MATVDEVLQQVLQITADSQEVMDLVVQTKSSCTQSINGLTENVSTLSGNVAALPGASATTPKASGEANAGSENAWARGDHVHPSQVDIAGNAATATKANQDSLGNIIAETYATLQWIAEQDFAHNGDWTTMQSNIASLSNQVLNLSKKVTRFELWAIDNGYTAS